MNGFRGAHEPPRIGSYWHLLGGAGRYFYFRCQNPPNKNKLTQESSTQRLQGLKDSIGFCFPQIPRDDINRLSPFVFVKGLQKVGGFKWFQLIKTTKTSKNWIFLKFSGWRWTYLNHHPVYCGWLGENVLSVSRADRSCLDSRKNHEFSWKAWFVCQLFRENCAWVQLPTC